MPLQSKSYEFFRYGNIFQAPVNHYLFCKVFTDCNSWRFIVYGLYQKTKCRLGWFSITKHANAMGANMTSMTLWSQRFYGKHRESRSKFDRPKNLVLLIHRQNQKFLFTTYLRSNDSWTHCLLLYKVFTKNGL